DLALAPHHALEHAGEVLRVRLGTRAIVRAVVGFAAQPVRLELVDDGGQIGLGQVHLIERLHRGKPGLATREPLVVARSLAGRAHTGPSSANTRSSAIRARHARTASAPLPLRPPRARSSAWASVSPVRMAFPS